jgi:epoxyqueuosine reductase
MGYLARDQARNRRANPRAILPECQSILVLGMRYPQQASFPVIDSDIHGKVVAGKATAGTVAAGKIAAYACGPDYHDLIPPRLEAIVRFLESQVGHPFPYRAYTDTGPLLERELAQRAGLGWIGKNTCLISPGLGSYFLLAEILLAIDLEADPPFLVDRCGTCRRCIVACPTSCILPDRTIDARRCISYLTIELKGAIPLDLRPFVGVWAFGCDICQQVCPWNRFDPSPPSACCIDLEKALALTPAEFIRLFRSTPLMRAKRRRFLRNVAIALGNTHDPAAVPALAQTLANEVDPLVRGHTAWAFGQIGGAATREILEARISVETDPGVCAEIESAMET